MDFQSTSGKTVFHKRNNPPHHWNWIKVSKGQAQSGSLTSRECKELGDYFPGGYTISACI